MRGGKRRLRTKRADFPDEAGQIHFLQDFEVAFESRSGSRQRFARRLQGLEACLGLASPTIEKEFIGVHGGQAERPQRRGGEMPVTRDDDGRARVQRGGDDMAIIGIVEGNVADPYVRIRSR